jgi:predicted transposase/invertase (TIGR01784 family)
LLNEESGDFSEKLIRMDIVFAMQFKMKLPGNDKVSYVNVTIDFEMQKDNPTEYKLVKRAIYYAASLLRDTLVSAEKYTAIHKVYSVWLCDFDFLESNRYVHRYNMLRNYHENGLSAGEAGIDIYEVDTDADLMEVIFIELTKLGEHMQDDLAKFLDTVFHNIGGLSNLMEEKIGVAIVDTALEKGVSDVVDMTKYAEIKEAQGELRGERKGKIETAVNLIKMGILTIKQIAQSTGLTEEEVIEAKNTIAEK